MAILRWDTTSGGKKVWLKSCEDLILVLEEINVEGRGNIWCVEKGLEDDIAPKAKKRRSDAQDR